MYLSVLSSYIVSLVHYCMLYDPQTELFVIRLLQRGASVSTAGRSGNTPLHLAATKGFTNVARKLLERGAIVMAKNNESKTSLELAVEFEHNDFAVLMVKSMEPSR